MVNDIVVGIARVTQGYVDHSGTGLNNLNKSTRLLRDRHHTNECKMPFFFEYNAHVAI